MNNFPSKKRGMKRGFTLIELMVAIATIAVLVALLLPEIQKAQDASLKHKQQDGPYWVYREYEYAGGPVISEMSGTYKHSLQEILDMYAINLKKQQKQNALEWQSNSDLDSPTESDASSTPVGRAILEAPDCEASYTDEVDVPELTKEEKIRKAKRAINNFKHDLSQDKASLVARRNVVEAIQLLEQDLKRLQSEL